MSIFLRHDGFDFPIMPGSMVIGRATDCQLVLQSSRVSRRHAMLVFTSDGLAVQDLNSANGVFVNGNRIEQRTPLEAGDEIILGDEVLSVIPGTPRSPVIRHASLYGRETQPPGAPDPEAETDPDSLRPPKPTAEPTVRADILSLIAKVADKMLALGKPSEADRILRPRLRQVLSHARTHETLPAGIAEEAARHAIKLAEANNDPTWVDYAIELHTALHLPLPQDVIEQLYTLLRVVPPIHLELLRQYLVVLDEASATFAPGDRFLVKRIRGLEGLAASR